jgi:hypothetical protein
VKIDKHWNDVVVIVNVPKLNVDFPLRMLGICLYDNFNCLQSGIDTQALSSLHPHGRLIEEILV